MPDFILPSKLVYEKIEVAFDFKDELGWLETLAGFTVSVEVYTGEDNHPEQMIFGRQQLLPTTVMQQFYMGVPGVIYNLICDARGSSGRIYRKVAKLAVLPSNAFNPPLIGTVFTTPPYPIDVTETVHAAVEPVEGRLKYQPFPLDEVRLVVTPQAGDLYGAGKSFATPVEAVRASVTPQDGALYGAGKAFSVRPESVRASIIPYSADLFGNGLTYTIQPHSVMAAVAPISGSLT